MGEDPIETISDRILKVINDYIEPNNELVGEVVENVATAQQGLIKGTMKHCKKCDKTLPKSDFKDPNTKTGEANLCKTCKPKLAQRQQRRVRKNKNKNKKRKCPNCNK